ncbi:UNVERIFIED_CONTAM: hypothetical protein K2H54_062547 [Gekko kuhli]
MPSPLIVKDENTPEAEEESVQVLEYREACGEAGWEIHSLEDTVSAGQGPVDGNQNNHLKREDASLGRTEPTTFQGGDQGQTLGHHNGPAKETKEKQKEKVGNETSSPPKGILKGRSPNTSPPSRKKPGSKSHRIHFAEGPSRCSYCGESFCRQSDLFQHHQSHTGEKPYHCSYCGKNFHEFSHLTKHEQLHTGERTYKCTDCGKNFSQRAKFCQHRKIHSSAF